VDSNFCCAVFTAVRILHNNIQYHSNNMLLLRFVICIASCCLLVSGQVRFDDDYYPGGTGELPCVDPQEWVAPVPSPSRRPSCPPTKSPTKSPSNRPSNRSTTNGPSAQPSPTAESTITPIAPPSPPYEEQPPLADNYFFEAGHCPHGVVATLVDTNVTDTREGDNAVDLFHRARGSTATT
jgi:hypothetical protein